MKYKEFLHWIHDRAADGQWSTATFAVSVAIVEELKKVPFWKRQKVWKNFEDDFVKYHMNPTNEKIERNNLK